jgi:dTDP-4-amino-4,6-dideoxygalactose transaminase
MNGRMNEGADPPIAAARIVFAPDDRARALAMIDEALSSGSLTLGPNTERFEAAFGARHAAPFAIAVSSGTSALEIILRTIGVEGREVVVPANTFFATAAAVVHAGGTPRLVDVERDTLALSAANVRPALDEQTAAVIFVHIGGFVTAEAEAVARLCRDRGVPLVEDAAHAHGAAWRGAPAGSFGTAAAFSFYPTKVMTTAEGGMIVTRDERIRDEAVIYRDQGKAGFLGGEHVRMGYAWRMSELHAAVGIVQLGRLDEFIAVRRRVADLYREGLEKIRGVRPLAVGPDCEPNYYKYVTYLDEGIDRQRVKDALRKRGVSPSGEVYATPLHLEPVFAHLATGDLTAAEDVCRRHLCLPIHSDMTDEEAGRVIAALGDAVQEATA